MREREEGWGLTEDGSGGGEGGSGGEGGRGVSGDGEGGSCGEGGSGGVDGGSGGVDEAARLRGVGGGSGGVDGARLWWLRGRRRRQETAAKWGDSESGRRWRGGSRDLGEKCWPGRNCFLVMSNLAVALFTKRAIAKLAIATFTKRATAIAM